MSYITSLIQIIYITWRPVFIRVHISKCPWSNAIHTAFLSLYARTMHWRPARRSEAPGRGVGRRSGAADGPVGGGRRRVGLVGVGGGWKHVGRS